MKCFYLLLLFFFSFGLFCSKDIQAQEKMELTRIEIKKEFQVNNVSLYKMGGNIMVYPGAKRKSGLKISVSGPKFLVDSLKFIIQKENDSVLITFSDKVPNSSPMSIRVIGTIDIEKTAITKNFIYDPKTLSISIATRDSLAFPQARLFLYE